MYTTRFVYFSLHCVRDRVWSLLHVSIAVCACVREFAYMLDCIILPYAC